MISIYNQYYRPSSRRVNVALGYPLDNGSISVVYPVKTIIHTFSNYPVNIPKYLILFEAVYYFKRFDFPEKPTFLFHKGSVFCYVSKRFKIASMSNFLSFVDYQCDEQYTHYMQEIISFFEEWKAPLKMTLSGSASNLFHLKSAIGRKTAFCCAPGLPTAQFDGDPFMFVPHMDFAPGRYPQAHKYDINGAYAYQLSKPLPKSLECQGRISQSKVMGLIDLQAIALITTKAATIIKPHHNPEDPLWISFEPLKHEIRRGNIKKIITSFTCSQTRQHIPLVKQLYSYRQNANRFKAKLSKMVLNSVYGQLAKKYREMHILDRIDCEDEMVHYIKPGESWKCSHFKTFTLLTREQSTFPEFSSPFVSLSIFQNHLLHFIPDIPDDAVYVDTDCFITEYKTKVKISSMLGDYKHSEVENLRIWSQKNYSSSDGHVLAGVKRSDTVSDAGFNLSITGLRQDVNHTYTVQQSRSLP
jgi:hypothetical protein